MMMNLNSDLSNKLNEEFPNRIYNSFLVTDLKEYHKGPYGIIFTADFQPPYEKVLIRLFSRDPITNDQVTGYRNEIQFLLDHPHPFADPFIGATFQPPFYFISQSPNASSLFDVIHTPSHKRELTANDKTRIVLCIASFMMYLHSLSVNYDLHPKNIFLPKTGFPILANYGSCPFSKYFQGFNDKYLTANSWTSPNAYKSGQISPKDNVYSFGIILWEIYTEHYPLPNIKQTNFKEKVVINNERPIIPINAPQTMKKLMELCWHTDPDKRPSFKQIYQLFVTGKVQFENTDKSVIDEIVKIVEDFQNKVKPKKKEFRSIQNIPAFFKSAKVHEISEYTQGLNETNCEIFFNGIDDLLNDKIASDQVREKGLFEILKLIVSNDQCLELYVKDKRERQLPFLIKGLTEVSLSILIPVFTKHPETYFSNYLGLFEQLVNDFSLKVIRLLYILSSSAFDHKINEQFMAFILKQSKIFIQNDCIFPMVQTMYKLINKDKALYAEYSNPIIKVLSSCLLSPSNESLVATYMLLQILHPLLIPVDSNTLIKHINDHAIRSYVLKVLCFSRPVKVTKNLLQTLLKETVNSEQAKFAVLLLAKFTDLQPMFLENRYIYLRNVDLDPEFLLKIILVLFQDPKFNITVFQQKPHEEPHPENTQYFSDDLTNFPVMLNRALSVADSSLLMAMGHILAKLDMKPNFVEILNQGGFVTNLVNLALKNSELRLRAYFIISLIGRANCNINEYVDLLPAAIEDLKSSATLRQYAVAYISLIEKTPGGMEEIERNNVKQIIHDLQEKKLI